jgi:hypothetical protein
MILLKKIVTKNVLSKSQEIASPSLEHGATVLLDGDIQVNKDLPQCYSVTQSHISQGSASWKETNPREALSKSRRPIKSRTLHLSLRFRLTSCRNDSFWFRKNSRLRLIVSERVAGSYLANSYLILIPGVIVYH